MNKKQMNKKQQTNDYLEQVVALTSLLEGNAPRNPNIMSAADYNRESYEDDKLSDGNAPRKLSLPSDITISRNAAIVLLHYGKVNQSQLDAMISRARARGKGLAICANDVEAILGV